MPLLVASRVHRGTQQVTPDLPSCVRATGIAVTPDGRHLYLPATGPGEIDTIAIIPRSAILSAVE